MAFLQYAARAYIVIGTDANAQEVYEIGPWYLKYMQATDLNMPSSGTAGTPAEYGAYFVDPGYVGGSIIAQSAEAATRLQQYNPTTIYNSIPAEYFASGTNYHIKLVFGNGKYAIMNQSTSTSGQGSRYTGYSAEGVRIGDICMSSPTNLQNTTNTNYNQYVIKNWTDPTSLPNSGMLLCYSFSTYSMSYQYRSSESVSLASTVTDEFFSDIEPFTPAPPSTDPYAPGGTSGPGGGSGTFDLSSDAVNFPALPTLSAVDTGLVTIYTPTLAQMRSLANYMWNADVQTVDWWKKLVANPLDLVLGLSIVPVTVPAGATQNIKVGFIDTGIAMTKAASQFVEVDCGSLDVTEFFGSALDYSPFRKTSIYLPFIGTRTLSTDDIMGKTVQVKYHIDILSGALTAMIKAGDAVLYQYSGSCSISLPLTGQTFTDMITSTIQLAAGIAGTVAGGGAVAGASLASAANNVMGMKPHIERAGGVSGPAGQLGIMRPYLIGEIPRQSVPENYNEFAGYPSNIKAVLGDLTGFTQVETVYLQGIAATDAELEEIETLLKEGVFINAA